MSKEETDSCACTQKLLDVLRAAKPKKDLLKKVTCTKCGKVFWTNRDEDFCFDCAPQTRGSPEDNQGKKRLLRRGLNERV